MEICAITNREWQPEIASVSGRYVAASNATLLAETSAGDQVIYKPIEGARPLWDFDARTLAIREVWTYCIDRALGFDLVPETVMADGPFGRGAVQRHVAAVADADVIELINGRAASLWPVAVLDVVVNNADRKAGHILRGADSKLWAIDHGLTFHTDDKLRTVLWGFAGRPLPDSMLAAVNRLLEELHADLGGAFAVDLSDWELHAMIARAEKLATTGRHPEPPGDRHAVPWPPY